MKAIIIAGAGIFLFLTAILLVFLILILGRFSGLMYYSLALIVGSILLMILGCWLDYREEDKNFKLLFHTDEK